MFETAYAASLVKASQESVGSGVGDFFTSILTMIPLVIAAIAVLIASFFVATAIKQIVGFRAAKNDLHPEMIILLSRTSYVGILGLGIIAALRIVRIDISSLIAFLGVGIGFALKDLLSNFFAGMMILTQKKFKIGDNVKVGGSMGKIVEIDARTTQVKAFDGTLLIIPNATMITNVIQNFTGNTFRRVSFPTYVNYSMPIGDSIKVCLRSVKKNPRVMPEPAPSVIATEFGNENITLMVRFWVESNRNWLLTRSEVIQQIKKDFDEYGIAMAFPTTTLNVDPYDENLMKAMHLPVAEPPHIPKFKKATTSKKAIMPAVSPEEGITEADVAQAQAVSDPSI